MGRTFKKFEDGKRHSRKDELEYKSNKYKNKNENKYKNYKKYEE